MAKYTEEKVVCAKKIDKLKDNGFITITSQDDFDKIADEKQKKNVLAFAVLNDKGKDRILDANGHVIMKSRRDTIRRFTFPTEKGLIIRESMLSSMDAEGNYIILAYEVKKLPSSEIVQADKDAIQDAQ